VIFTEPRFLLFFLVVFAVHWLLSRQRARKVWLLACSYAFYAGWDWRFLSLILTSTLVDYVAGAMLGRERPPGGRRLWLGASLAANLGILAFFKYCNFFLESAADFARFLGLGVSPPVLAIVLPVGISFYTFQTLSYTIDVYQGRLRPTTSPLDFALFVAFFPQLVAGPIVRASSFLPQLERKARLAEIDFRPLLLLFLVGFVKKACVSDNIAPVLDPVFADPAAFGRGANALAAFLYHVQIYCDFSGYTDMAIAVAGMLGYRLAVNFDFPYVSRNAAEFWRRWHISLSTWFRDYVYIPLGGSQVLPGRLVANLFVTFVLSGLWHGASWNFVLWGFLHACLVALVWWWGRHVRAEGRAARAAHALGPLLTTLAVVLTWIVFRSTDLGKASAMLGTLFGLRPAGSGAVEAGWWLLVAGFLAVHWALHRRILAARLRALPDWAFALGLGVAVALALPFVAGGYKPFIYFQF
jgi:alginate O-acetyltransferase complex protein AlgI